MKSFGGTRLKLGIDSVSARMTVQFAVKRSANERDGTKVSEEESSEAQQLRLCLHYESVSDS